MVQGLFGGGTSYEGQSISDIKEDVNNWKIYTENVKSQIVEKKEALIKNGFWNKIPWNFQQTINESIFCLGTFLSDFQIVESAFEENFISEREIKLLRKIGKNSVQFNHSYGKYFKEEYEWREYGNPEFEIVESIYQHGRDFFVTLQDASNAAGRLEDYMSNNSIYNKVNIFGNSYNTNIQQGHNNNMIVSIDDMSELLSKLDLLLENLNDSLPEEEVEEAQEYIETIKDEAIKEKPKKTMLRFAVDSLKKLKWSTEFLASVATIAQLVAPLL
ncbi:hypothetical protein EWI08_02865 [Enterococcus faecium]|nr:MULTISPECIES: hypothetical protein [Enterococcus]AOM34610.1 hypothetical protein AL021_09485 [Enterococcus faecium]AVJ42388.1 hypothetical protein CXH17_06850 [Enterococcus faecium]EGP5166975.1 hypothetical protein [Enterococcus faecium]EGP5295100.1 hypothetical protein [Enterococcus faecium]EGP5659971.1 hypothetical protein [Enterococcus faecium]